MSVYLIDGGTVMESGRLAQRVACWVVGVVVIVMAMGPRPAAAVPWEQRAKLLPDDETVWNSFGYAVDISGTTAVVGARYDDDCGWASGSAYIFEKDVSGWTQSPKLLPDDGVVGDQFGCSVGISGATAIFGANQHDSMDLGSAYIFEKGASGWTQEAKLLADDRARDDGFGLHVDVSGTTAIVGALGDGDFGDSSGSAYIFEKGTSGWTQSAKLLPNDGAADDRFGVAVSVSGTTAVVGAFGNDDCGIWTGSAYIFEKGASDWTQVAKLLPSDAAEWDWFGVSVDVSGATAVVGAPWNDDCGSGSGSAYVFEKGDSGWTEVAKLLPHDGAEYECFGSSVAVTGTTVVIGAWGSTDHGSIPGSAYVFEKGVSGWTEVARLFPDDGAPYDHIGCSVAVSGTTALVGAYGYGDTGSAYIFEPIPEPATLGLFGLVGIATAWSARRRRNTR